MCLMGSVNFGSCPRNKGGNFIFSEITYLFGEIASSALRCWEQADLTEECGKRAATFSVWMLEAR